MTDLSPVASMCDDITCARVGTLAAYGWSEGQIADALLLSPEQVQWAKTTEQFRGTFGKYSADRVEAAITRAEGWDAVEDKALECVISALEYNRDPRFALQAARVANAASRRVGGNIENTRVINAQKTNTVIVLSLNKGFVEGKANGVIDVSAREIKELPRKQSDVPTPQTVSNLLSPARKEVKLIKGMHGTPYDDIDIGGE